MDHGGRHAGRSWDPLTDALVSSNPTPTLAGARLVLACEDPPLRDTLAAALALDGHDIVEARTALDLIHRVGGGPSSRRAPPEVVVLDTSGSRWATLEMLEAVCGEDWSLPVIALVRARDQDARGEARRLGAKAVLEIPVDEAALRAEVLAIVSPVPTHRGAA